MKLIISDIHGNLEALISVLCDASHFNIKECFILGDLVDYGADSAKVVSLINSLPSVTCVRGNHDDAIFNKTSSQFRTEHGRQSFEITKKEFTKKSDTFSKLSNLTSKRLIKFNKNDDDSSYVKLYHGLGRDLWRTYDDLTPFEEDGLTIDKLTNIELCGHSHIQGYTKSKGKLILNPGSVGQPRNGDPRAQYLLIEDDWSKVYPRRVDYDVDLTAKKIVDSGRPNFLATRLYLGI